MVFVPPDASKPTVPTLAPPPLALGSGGGGAGGRLGNKRRGGPGLKLSFEHLQISPASSIPSSTETSHNNNISQQNTFREQVGNIVCGNTSSSSSRSALQLAIDQPAQQQQQQQTSIPPVLVSKRYPGCGEDDEDEDDGDDSLAASYLAAAREQQQQKELPKQQEQQRKNNNIPVLREAPRPPGPPSAGSVASRYYPGDNGANITTTSTTTNLTNTAPASSSASSSSSSSVTTTTTENTDDNSQFMEMKPEDLDVIKLLGEGAAGTVRKVLHKPTRLIMAKKTIGTDPNPKIQRQILRELSFQKTCNSPYIVSFYGAFLEDGDTTLSLCMEYCEAGSLEDIYKRARDLGGIIGEPVLGRIAESVCKGLVYLHQQRVIHRDIKPSNILVTRKGEIKLCDFGVSGELINSIAKTFTGTKYYMAPERIQGAPYAVQSDIWSLGLTLIEVSQNHPALPPPDQPQLSIIELLDLIVRQPVPVIQGSHISKECRNFVAVCLIKNPRDRPGPGRMLEHPFIRKWEDVPMDVAGWVKDVWNWK